MPHEAAPGFSETENSAETETTLEASLKDARDAFYDLTFDEGFNGLLSEQKLSPEDTDKPEFWHMAAGFASDKCAGEQKNGASRKQLVLHELFAATPSFIYDNALLGQNNQSAIPEEEFRAAKENVSYFNSLIRETAEAWPDMPASTLAKNLMGIATISIEDNFVKHRAVESIRSSVRGAQHELAFGQLLEKTGRGFHSANVEEDLDGIDYVVQRPNGGEDYIDVKASLFEIESRGGEHNALFARKSAGHLVMYSMLKNGDLDDKFFIPDEVAATRGQLLEETLEDAEPIRAGRHLQSV
jgi:hypothetical protein